VKQGFEIGAIKDDLFGFNVVLVAIFGRDYQKAQEMLSIGSSQYYDMEQRSVPKVLLWAQISRLMGDQELEHKHYSSAKEMLEARILEQPEDPQLHSALGIALAGLGSIEAAIREGKIATELLPIDKEAWSGLFLVENLARIYVMVGEHDMATELVEYLLSIPGELSIPLLRLDPAWKPLHDHPPFKKLIESGK